MGRPAALPWPIFDVDSVAHLLTVVRRRERLRPRIGRPDQAMTPSTPLLPAGALPARREGGRLLAWHGSERAVISAQFGSGATAVGLHDYVAVQED